MLEGFSTRKGVSPLIATAMLILIAISAAALVTSFLIPYIREITGDVKDSGIQCSASSIYIREVTYECSKERLSILYENNGDITLDEFALSVLLGRQNNVRSFSFDVPSSELEPGVRAIIVNDNITASMISTNGQIEKLILFSRLCPSHGDSVKGDEITLRGC